MGFLSTFKEVFRADSGEKLTNLPPSIATIPDGIPGYEVAVCHAESFGLPFR